MYAEYMIYNLEPIFTMIFLQYFGYFMEKKQNGCYINMVLSTNEFSLVKLFWSTKNSILVNKFIID
jgi:hypothetical protein